jgi:hypothetical protein
VTASDILGGVGGTLAVVAGLLYILDIVRGATRPQKVTWAVWCLIGVLGTGGTFKAGSGAGSIVPLAYLMISFVVLLLCLFGYSKPGGQPYDWILGLVVSIILICWRYGNWNAYVAVSVAVCADLSVTWLTIRDTWIDPCSESAVAWCLSSVGASFGLAAVEHISFSAVAYPAYLAMANSATAGIIVLRRRRAAATPGVSL